MTTEFERALGWRPQTPEARLKNWRLRHFISPRLLQLAQEIQSRDWPIASIADQGNTGHCVGAAWKNNGVSEPQPDAWKDDMIGKLYYRAKEYDGEPNQENGSTTQSGVRAFMDFTKIENNIYAWAQSEPEVRVWVVGKAPVIMGSWWTYDMLTPDRNGLVHPTGGRAGGHEWMVSGFNAETNLYHCTNSWGTGWGVNGQFYITPEDLASLLADDGDACTCVEMVVEPTPPEPPSPEPDGCLAAILGVDRKLTRLMKHFHVK